MDDVQSDNPYSPPRLTTSHQLKSWPGNSRSGFLLASVICGSVIAPLVLVAMVVAFGNDYVAIYLFLIVLLFSLYAAMMRPAFSLFANVLFTICLMLVLMTIEFPELLAGKVPASFHVHWTGIAVLFGCATAVSGVAMFVRNVKPNLLRHWVVLDTSRVQIRSQITYEA